MRKSLLIISTVICALSLVMLDTPLQGSTFDGNIPNDGQNYVGRIIILTDPTPRSGLHCGESFSEYNAVIINPGGDPVIVTQVGIDPSFTFPRLTPSGQSVNIPGTRFGIISQEECGGRLNLSLVPVTSSR